MKAEFLNSTRFGDFIHLSEGESKANIAKSANGSFYLYMDHFREPLKLKDNVLLTEVVQMIESEWLNHKRKS